MTAPMTADIKIGSLVWYVGYVGHLKSMPPDDYTWYIRYAPSWYLILDNKVVDFKKTGWLLAWSFKDKEKMILRLEDLCICTTFQHPE